MNHQLHIDTYMLGLLRKDVYDNGKIMPSVVTPKPEHMLLEFQ